jgi:hypothetical protein
MAEESGATASSRGTTQRRAFASAWSAEPCQRLCNGVRGPTLLFRSRRGRDKAGKELLPSFVEKTIELETGKPCTLAQRARREGELRGRITRLMHCDASRSPAISDCNGCYDVVVSNFCAESATSDPVIWRAYMHNISSLVRPGGTLIVSALKGARC